MRKVAIALTATTALLSGCTSIFNTGGASEFACPGMPSGVLCKRPSEVYKDTMTRDDLNVKSSDNASDGSSDRGGSKTTTPKSALKDQPPLVGVVLSPVEASRQMAFPTMPKPVLEPAAVVRVWIAPYITDRGDLRYPGYVFSEITPRRWSYGEEAIKDARIITPLQIEPRESGNFVSATRDDSDDVRVATPVPPSVQKLQQLTPLRMGSPQPASPASNRASSPMTPTN